MFWRNARTLFASEGLHRVTTAGGSGGNQAGDEGQQHAYPNKECEAVPIRGWLGLVPRGIIVCLLPNLVNLVVYGWGSDAAYLRQYAAGIWHKLKQKRSA